MFLCLVLDDVNIYATVSVRHFIAFRFFKYFVRCFHTLVLQIVLLTTIKGSQLYTWGIRACLHELNVTETHNMINEQILRFI